MTQQDKQPEKPSKPPIIGSYDIEADVDLGDSLAQEFGKYSARKASLDPEKIKQEIRRMHAERQAVMGSKDIEADTDLGSGDIAEEFGRYSERKLKEAMKAAEQEDKVISTDLEEDQTRTDINVGTEE
ncbi:hypothetical protein [Dictyobacter kobayashii]|uniref:Uncharacterized protein n=1 Tax=Dictyobacter kobayashii TaxID=2014872 RepID=A0A402AEM3_9CHLR|nr:hypothetical protein [Dictyobacter kobayashii]GCE17536.1 hypothetical protein KDK_13360 [Dictyobacter kobayashii]